MKLHPDKSELLSVTGYGPGWIAVNGEQHKHSLLLAYSGEKRDWACQRFDALSASHFDQVLPFRPELVLFGSGTRLRFVNPALLANLMAQGIGVETMDTAAACRTFNILAGEGRKVVAGFLLETLP